MKAAFLIVYLLVLSNTADFKNKVHGILFSILRFYFNQAYGYNRWRVIQCEVVFPDRYSNITQYCASIAAEIINQNQNLLQEYNKPNPLQFMLLI